MSGPALYLLQHLGPDFDYSVLNRLVQSKDWAALPDDAKKAISDLQGLGLTLGHLAAPAAPDQIQRGAFANPYPKQTDFNKQPFFDQAWAVLGNVPIVGLVAQWDRANSIAAATGKPVMDAWSEENARVLNAAQEWGHQISVGMIPSPKVGAEQQQAFNAVVKPIAGVAAVAMQGAFVFKTLGLVSKLPQAGPMIEALGPRLTDVGLGAGTLGILDALRAEGVPDDPAAIDLSGRAAKYLTGLGLNPRLALFLSGSAVGAVPGALLGGIARGREFMETAAYSRAATAEQMAEMRDILVRSGVELTGAESRWSVAQQYTRMLRKLVQREPVAGLVGEVQAREEWVAQQLFGSATIAPESEESRYLQALLKGQPGAISVAKNITNTAAVEDAANKLGLRVLIQRVKRGETTIEPELQQVSKAIAPDAPIQSQIGALETKQLSVDEVLKIKDRSLIPTEFARDFNEALQKTGDQTQAIEQLKASGKTYGVPTPSTPTFAQEFGSPAAGEAKIGPPTGLEPPRPVPEDMAIPAGVKPQAKKVPIYDVLVNRPKYVYPTYDEVSRQTKRATNVMANLSKETARDVLRKPTSELVLLADGNVIRGGLDADQLTAKLHPQAPKVDGIERPDLAIRHVSQAISLEVQDGEKLAITLPSRITQEQFDNLAPAVNTKVWKEVSITDAKGNTRTLPTPFGQQVQDAVAEQVAPTRIGTTISPEMVSQFKKTGVFKGQAAVLADGTPVAMENKAGFLYQVRDNFTGELIKVHPSKLTILPTSLEGELAPGNFFMTHLAPEEQQAFAKLRRGLQLGLDKPVEKFKELAAFANSRGFIATALKGGQIELARATDGEAMNFADLKSAASYVRSNTQPLPDLTPPEVKQLLGGNTNFGFVAPPGGPLQFGELMPIPHDRFIQSMEDNLNGRGPGAFAKLITPTRGLVLDMDKRFGTTFYPAFENVQSRYVGKQNFETLWYYGKGGKLPEDVMPLRKIMDIAGPESNGERITAILEGAKPADATAQELSAAGELRKWYNALFTEYGIEANYVQDYAPRVRELMRKFGNPQQAFMQMANDPLYARKAGEFWADNIRQGTLDVYDTEAFRVATRYLQQGANNRFMKEAIDQASEVISRMGTQNQQLALPLAYFLQAVRGYEFWDQRIAISESAQRMLEGLRVIGKGAEVHDLSEKLANYWMGAVYGSTMGLRPGLAARNVATGLMMTWPLYGGKGSRFVEAMSMAMTEEGRNAAIADRAIALKQGPAMAATMREPVLGGVWDQISRSAFAMYDGSDQYTRAVSYWTGRMKAQDALDRFFAAAKDASPTKLVELKNQLIKDSGLYIQDSQVVNEFLRRAGTSPEGAARYAGKAASDVTNFLYGRGMQPRWMRGVGGRLLGQFGTWPLWYIDYLRRSTTNMVANGYKAEAAAFIARHALTNAAIAYAGSKVLNVDLGRWMMYPSVFYSGGPGWQVAQGLSTLARGLGAVASGGEDPTGPTKIREGLRSVEQVIPSMIPFYYAGRDAVKFAQATDATERLAWLLSTRPTQDYTFQQHLDMVLGRADEAWDVMTGSPQADQYAREVQQGQPTVPLNQVPAVVAGLESRGQQPGGAPAPIPAPVVAPASRGALPEYSRPPAASTRVRTPPGISYQNPTEVRGTTEAKRPNQY